jgi:heme/copper-type cytochrome/quinol oxidase subunit 4
MFGGYSLLRLIPVGRLSGFQHANFRAGHAHAGVLLVLSLVVLDISRHGGLGATARWVLCLLLLVGVLAQSGGFFLHMGFGKSDRWSAGNTLTVGGAVLLAAAMITAAVGVAIG